MTLKKSSILTALVLSTIALAQTQSAATPAAPVSVNTNPEKAAWEALMFPVGEYAAYATYDAVIKKYGNVEPYATILRSEQQHINALTRQLQRYGVAVPANPYLGKVTLPADLVSVARAEAQTEIDNAGLFDKLMGQAASDPMLQKVFTNLQNASRNVHLPLFNQAVAAGGQLSAAAMTSFQTQHVNQKGQNQQGMNRGGAMRQGMNQGQGKGQGNGQQMRGQGNRQGQNQLSGQGMRQGRHGQMQGQGHGKDGCPMGQHHGGMNQKHGHR